jgi:hypothetical protein
VDVSISPRDGAGVYFKSHDAMGHASIWYQRLTGGRPTCSSFDDSRVSRIAPTSPVGAGRFFFAMNDRRATCVARSHDDEVERDVSGRVKRRALERAKTSETLLPSQVASTGPENLAALLSRFPTRRIAHSNSAPPP